MSGTWPLGPFADFTISEWHGGGSCIMSTMSELYIAFSTIWDICITSWNLQTNWLCPVFQARDVYEEAIQTVMTVRDFGQVTVGLLTETFSIISKASSPLLCCNFVTESITTLFTMSHCRLAYQQHTWIAFKMTGSGCVMFWYTYMYLFVWHSPTWEQCSLVTHKSFCFFRLFLNMVWWTDC